MNEKVSDYSLHVLERFGDAISDYTFCYFHIAGFRRSTTGGFWVLSSTRDADEEGGPLYDLTVFFARSLCLKIVELLDDKDIALRLKVFLERSDETDFLFENSTENPLFIQISARLGEKQVFDDELIVPFIATKVCKSPAMNGNSRELES